MQAKHLLDVAVIATTLGGVFLLLDGVVLSSRHKLKPLMVVDLSSDDYISSIHDHFEQFSIDEGQPIHHAIDAVSFYEEDPVQYDTYYEENRALKQETPPQQQPIDAGDLAELYGPNSQFATPVIVNSWESDDGKGGIVYSLIHAGTRQEIASMVDSSSVHRYEPYPEGTDAVCALDQAQGLRKKPTISPCRVLRVTQHTMSPKGTPGFPKERTFVTYKVTYVNVSGENVETNLPFGNVSRVLKSLR